MNWIYDYSYAELENKLLKLKLKSFTVKQISGWIYGKINLDINQWTNISKEHRIVLKKHFNLSLNQVIETKEDQEGNKKFLIELIDKKKIECVLIKEKDHYTFCLSTQVGCPLGCVFCATGKMGFVRNLSSGEIITQVLILKKEINEIYTEGINLVFMGMGEPLLNYLNLKKALKIITGEGGIGISPKSITVSTAGILENIKELEKDFPRVKLSFSLNAATQELREKIMPIAKKEKVADILKYFKITDKCRKHRITFEYVLLENINDSREDARKMAELLKSINCKINIIPYNDNNLKYKTPKKEEVEKFAQWLRERNYTVMVRWSKGKELKSACGQLATKN